jgi:hypothetical protein
MFHIFAAYGAAPHDLRREHAATLVDRALSRLPQDIFPL